jgi:uncharacterized FlaG/YvyC family protein
MRISPGQSQGTPVDPPSTPPTQVRNDRVATEPSTTKTEEKTAETGGTAAVTPLQRQTDVTYRQDNNGRVYYSVSDAKSGQEILEVPPKELRDVSQGIEDYVKAQESKAGSHVKVKA